MFQHCFAHWEYPIQKHLRRIFLPPNLSASAKFKSGIPWCLAKFPLLKNLAKFLHAFLKEICTVFVSAIVFYIIIWGLDRGIATLEVLPVDFKFLFVDGLADKIFDEGINFCCGTCLQIPKKTFRNVLIFNWEIQIDENFVISSELGFRSWHWQFVICNIHVELVKKFEVRRNSFPVFEESLQVLLARAEKRARIHWNLRINNTKRNKSGLSLLCLFIKRRLKKCLPRIPSPTFCTCFLPFLLLLLPVLSWNRPKQLISFLQSTWELMYMFGKCIERHIQGFDDFFWQFSDNSVLRTQFFLFPVEGSLNLMLNILAQMEEGTHWLLLFKVVYLGVVQIAEFEFPDCSVLGFFNLKTLNFKCHDKISSKLHQLCC